MGKVAVAFAAAAAVIVSCSVAAVMVGRRVKSRRKWRGVVEILKELEEACDTPVGRLRQVVDAVAVEMHAGLASEGGSKLKMLLTFVHHLPIGTEKGTYYALHLGGTYFRILRVLLGGERSYLDVQDVERHPIPSHLMNSTSEVLFNFLAFSLERFIEKEGNGSSSSQRELAFTFSFPVKHSSISSGALIKWTKGFEISEMVGKDVAECLQGALNRRSLDMHVAALVNDTVGALSLGYYHDPDTVVAVVFGTGSNACYLERTDAIIKSQGLLTTSGSMVVNMEWGNFWSSHLPRTSYDIDLDAESSNPNDMGFEKMIGGLYLGDIVRRVILRMSQVSDIFGTTLSMLSEPYVLRTNSVSAMHEDDTPELQEVARILKDLGVSDVPLKVRKLVVKICDVVTRRAGRLAAAGIAGILKKIGRDGSGGITSVRSRSETQMQKRTVVAVEGGLYMNYTMFREYMEEALVEILGEEVSQYVVVKAMEDGSSIGSALLVASLQS
ncbi:Hexokinase-3 [Raphanus sativus]|uniref:Phosphotransferase n=1 Tax=Raphanus sativus TaxID=3726 RepID=A0A6J0NPW8_RAPSA|nr:hexokinase-3 [Raphanus sativus]KAJ4896607.1 Hexokinase-3 [Raphanus sativus]